MLKELINIANKVNRPLYVPFLDVTKAYDKADLDAVLYSAYQRGLKGNTWQLLKEMNSNLSARIRTKHGLTRIIRMIGVMKQGVVSSTKLYSGHIDDIVKALLQEGLGIPVNELGEIIAALLWVDDIAGATTDPNELQRILNVIDDIAKRYRIEFGASKSKVLVIGAKKDTPTPTFYVGDMKLDYCDSYKYLGEHINSKNNLDNHLKELRGKVEGAYQTILTVAQDRFFKGIQLETIWKMYQTSILAIILYSSETWRPRKGDLSKLNSLHESYIKRILMTPISTPREVIYLETGLLDIEHMIYIRRINMYFRLQENTNELHEQLKSGGNNTWWTDTEDIMKRFSIDPMLMSRMGKGKRSKTIHEKVRESFIFSLLNQAADKSKLRYYLEHQQGEFLIMKPYLMKLNRFEASALFKARCRMFEAKGNYKAKYTDLSCRLCNSDQESQDHVLLSCANGITGNGKFTIENLFRDNDLVELKRVAKSLIKTSDKLKAQP